MVSLFQLKIKQTTITWSSCCMQNNVLSLCLAPGQLNVSPHDYFLVYVILCQFLHYLVFDVHYFLLCIKYQNV
jgi:hypothetical protein